MCHVKWHMTLQLYTTLQLWHNTVVVVLTCWRAFTALIWGSAQEKYFSSSITCRRHTHTRTHFKRLTIALNSNNCHHCYVDVNWGWTTWLKKITEYDYCDNFASQFSCSLKRLQWLDMCWALEQTNIAFLHLGARHHVYNGAIHIVPLSRKSIAGRAIWTFF